MAGFDPKLWVAQGFGIGRVPVAPGTFGSILGLGWFALLVRLGNAWWFGAGILMGLLLSVWLCGAGEKILQQKDPASVVLDEITAMPLCYAGWIAALMWRDGKWPVLDHFFGPGNWKWSLLIFAAFRVFDVAKPWPVKQSQSLPGGWGVTVDDFLAAIYVALLTAGAWLLRPMVSGY